MANETNDVKELETDSSPVATDVKTPTFESTATAMIEELTKDPSPEDEKSLVLEKNKTDEKKEVESVDAEVDDKKKDEKKPEGDVEDEDETEEEDKAASKHEEAIPYERFKEVNDKASRYEESAKAQDSLVNYCQTNNISPDEFRNTLEILRLSKSDPKAALERLSPFIETLKVSTGTGLPADLAKEVDEARAEFSEGLISKARLEVIERRSGELAKARIQHTSLEQQQRVSLQQQQVAEQQQFIGALSAWAGNKKTLDPSFMPKAKPTDKDGKFEDFIKIQAANWTSNPPRTVAEAVSLADKSLVEVNEMIARYQPKPKARKAPPSNGHSRSSSNSEPKSAEDVLEAVAAKHGY